MAARSRKLLGGWLVRPAKRPSAVVRLAFFVLVLVALAGSYAVTESEGVQILVLFGAVFGLERLAWHVFGRADPLGRQMRGRNPPLRVYLASVTFALVLGVLLYAVFRDSRFGPWSLGWLFLWPWLEFHDQLSRRSLRDGGSASWTRSRPLRDSAVAGVAASVLIAGGMLIQEFPAEDVLAGALGCGAIVFLIALLLGWAADGARY